MLNLYRGACKLNNLHFSNFPDFYEHPVIKSLAPNKKWTYSDADKRPIDIVKLRDTGHVFGAKYTNDSCLVDLNTLIELIPEIANHAYYMDCFTDDIVVLDIESKCPDDIKAKLLDLPYLYGEKSLSGKGYHLLFPLPKNFDQYPIAKKKLVLKEPHGYYEILLNHWVTFTRNMLPPSKPGNNKFETLFAALASKAVEVQKAQLDVSMTKPEIPYEDEIISVVNAKMYDKQPDYFQNDMSKWEFGYVGFFNKRLEMVLKIDKFRTHNYNETEKVWLLYEAIKATIPYRSKHDTVRNNMPWLMYNVVELRARRVGDKK